MDFMGLQKRWGVEVLGQWGFRRPDTGLKTGLRLDLIEIRRPYPCSRTPL